MAEKPGDDATACVVRIRKTRADEYSVRSAVKPRRLRQNDVTVLLKGGKTHSLRRYNFFYCGEIPRESRLKPSLNFEKSDVPPIAEIEGVDLVTEGVITVNKVSGICEGLP